MTDHPKVWKTALKLFALAALGIVLWLAAGLKAAAQEVCQPPARTYEQMSDLLGEKYKETPRIVAIVVGPNNQRRVMEMWGSKNGKSWTIIIRHGNCAQMVVSGMNYFILDAQAPSQET
jgi:hypothetical protein